MLFNVSINIGIWGFGKQREKMGFETRLKTVQIIFKSKINREIIPKTWTNNKIGTTYVHKSQV